MVLRAVDGSRGATAIGSDLGGHVGAVLVSTEVRGAGAGFAEQIGSRIISGGIGSLVDGRTTGLEGKIIVFRTIDVIGAVGIAMAAIGLVAAACIGGMLIMVISGRLASRKADPA